MFVVIDLETYGGVVLTPQVQQNEVAFLYMLFERWLFIFKQREQEVM